MLKPVIFLLMVCCVSYQVHAQKALAIKSMHVYPPFPTINDSVYIIIDAMTMNSGLNHNYKSLDKDTAVVIQGCYVVSDRIDTTRYIDTVNLGLRPKGNLIVYFKGHSSKNRETCFDQDSISDALQFQVVDFIDVDIEPGQGVKCYPYPYADEYITVQAPFEITKIEVMSGSGKFLINERVDFKNEHVLDVGELAKGGYYLIIFDPKGGEHRVRVYVR